MIPRVPPPQTCQAGAVLILAVLLTETGAQRAEEAHPDGWKLGGGVLTKPQLSDLQNRDRDARLSGGL